MTIHVSVRALRLMLARTLVEASSQMIQAAMRVSDLAMILLDKNDAAETARQR